MKSIFTLVISCFLFVNTLCAQILVVPGGYETTAGGITFTGLLANSTRVYQWLINENQLTTMVGTNLTGFSMRLPSNATAWPTVDATFPSYEVYLGGSVAPANRSLTFADNISSPQVQVRSGSLLVLTNSYPTGKTVNDFGPEITFTTPYLYSGGHLLMEVRHTGHNTTSRSTDAIGTSVSGYGTNFSALWASSLTATAGSQGNFTPVKFSYSATLPVKFISFSALLKNEDAILSWRAASLQNSKSFMVERSVDGARFTTIGKVDIPSNSSVETQYNFVDKKIQLLVESVIYYRLKMEEASGHFTYSNVLAVKTTGKIVDLSMYPNPVKDAGNISINSLRDEKMEYAIVNMNGQRIDNGTYFLQKGNNVLSIDFSALPKGIYNLILQTNGEKKQVRFVKE